jgi:DNA-binding transcriptional ArsR family regulator
MEPLDQLEIDDIEVFEVLNNPLRLRILRCLTEPMPIREVAERLDVPPTRLYYHVNLLEEAGVIAVVETRKVGAMLQKVYQTRAKSFRPSAKLSQGDHDPVDLAKAATGLVLDGARVDAEEALARHFTRVRSGDDQPKVPGSIGRSFDFLTEKEAKDFAEKLEKLLTEEFDGGNSEEDRTEYSFTYVFFPLAGATPEDGK